MPGSSHLHAGRRRQSLGEAQRQSPIRHYEGITRLALQSWEVEGLVCQSLHHYSGGLVFLGKCFSNEVDMQLM